jgi:hypothetical protein
MTRQQVADGLCKAAHLREASLANKRYTKPWRICAAEAGMSDEWISILGAYDMPDAIVSFLAR